MLKYLDQNNIKRLGTQKQSDSYFKSQTIYVACVLIEFWKRKCCQNRQIKLVLYSVHLHIFTFLLLCVNFELDGEGILGKFVDFSSIGALCKCLTT